MINTKFLSGNMLKIIAAVAMLIDHIGVMLLPEVGFLRIIGRLAFPIFAFFIAEGCRYTKNKLRYFLNISVLAVFCQIAYYFFDGSLYMGILVTFSISVLMIYALQNFKTAVFSGDFHKKHLTALIFFFAVSAVYIINLYIDIDYGFWGCVTPVFASIFMMNGENIPDEIKKYDSSFNHVLLMGISLLILSASNGGIQYWSMLALPVLFLYSGKRGKRKMKCFFYIFYPLHHAVLQIINILITS